MLCKNHAKEIIVTIFAYIFACFIAGMIGGIIDSIFDSIIGAIFTLIFTAIFAYICARKFNYITNRNPYEGVINMSLTHMGDGRQVWEYIP